MFVVLHCFVIVAEIEVCISELAVDGTEGAQIVSACLNGGLEEGHASPAVAGLTQPLALQSQLQAH